jgi:hypothetical protein
VRKYLKKYGIGSRNEIFVHPEAEKEFVEAIDYFEKVENGLGYDFAVEVYSGIERASAFPKLWPILEGDIHRCLVRRFQDGNQKGSKL